MGYVIVGGICLMVGAVLGMFLTAILTISKRTEYYSEEADKSADR